MSGFPISITWSVASPPVDVFNQMAGAASKLDSALAASGANFDRFGQTVQQLESPLSGVGQSMGELEGSMSGLEGSLGGAAGSMGDFAGSTGELNGAISETGGFVQEAAGGMEDLASGATDSGGAMGELGGAIEETNGGFEDLVTGVEDTSTGFEDLGTGIEETNTGFADLATGVEDTTTGMADLTTGVEDTSTGMEDLSTATEDTATGLGDMSSAADDSATSMDDFATGTDTAVVAAGDLQSGIDPLNTGLETMGTGLDDAATSGDTFSGALGGMNDQIPGVTGGLTDANMLTKNLAGGMSSTSSATEGTTRSLGLLGAGMGAVIGTGVLMFNAFDRIGDSAVGVELAQGRVITTQSRLEAQMIGLVKKTTELNAKYKDQVTGIGAWNSAMTRLDALLKAGVTSGAEWDAALTALKAAQDGMSSSTHSGQIFVDQLGAALGRTEAAAIKLTGANLGATNAQEAHNQAVAEMVTTIIPGMLGGFSGVFTALSGWRASTDLLKSAWLKLTPSLATVIPILAAMKAGFIGVAAAIAPIAIPIGIVIGAFAAFVAAVTAIRANIRVFDELGVKVGEVFPQMKGFLDDARQAFINLSDGLNTAISFALGGIDQLTGGIGNLKAQWDGFTSTLPQGTGELGMAGRAFREAGILAGDFGETLNVGAGKWKEAEGVLMRLNGSVLASAGNWAVARDGTAVYVKEVEKVAPVTMETTTAMDAMGAAAGAVGFVLKKQSANYSELTAAQKFNVAATNAMIEGITKTHEEMAMATAIAVNYLEQIAGVNTELFTSNAIITGVSDALQNKTAKEFEAVRAATAHVVGLRGLNAVIGLTDPQVLALSASIKEEEKALGKSTEEVAKHVQELEKMQQALSDTNAELAFYADAAKMAERMQLEFNTGVAEAKKAIQDETFALANMAGELSVWSDAQQRAIAIGNAFARGILEQQKASQGLVTAFAQSVGKLQELERQLKSGASTILAFNQGLVDGKTKGLEFTDALAKSSGEAMAFGAELRKLAQAAGVDLQSALGMSVSQLEDLLGAMALAPDAVGKAINAFDELGQKIVDSLADAAKEGHDAFMDEIDKLQEELGVEFSEPLIQKLEVEANIENAKSQVQSLLGILATTLRNQPLEVALQTQAAQDALGLLRGKVDELAKSAPQAVAPLQSALDKLAAWQPGDGLTTLPGILAEIVIGSANLEGGMQGAITSFNSLFQSVAAGAGGLEALKTAFTSVGLSLDTATGKITNAAGVVVAELGKLGPAAGTMATEVDAGLLQMSASGDAARDAWARDMQIMFLAVDQFGKHAQVMALTVSGAYSNMATNVTASLNRLASGILIVIAAFTKIQTGSQTMATTVSGSFSNMATNAASSMSRIASSSNIVITAFTRISSEATKMNSAVSSAMSSMASKTSSFASSFSSAMSKVSSSASSATSKVKSLQSAINSLKSKSITITVTTVYRTIYAAGGGAFISSSPQKIGPMHVSEFGQKELVTVTPIEGPGRNKIKGLSDIMAGGQEEGAKKGRRALARETEGTVSSGGRKEMVMMRETPIIIQIDGREITRVVNKRMFEESDALT